MKKSKAGGSRSDAGEDALLPRAFAVEGELGPDSGPPTTGLDYLRQVRWEAKRVPHVVLSDIDPRDFDDRQTTYAQLPPKMAAAPPGLAPDPVWEKKFLTSFEELQQELQEYYNQHKSKHLGQKLSNLFASTTTTTSPSLPPIKDDTAWKRFCLGSKPKEGREPIPPNRPSLSIILQLDHV